MAYETGTATNVVDILNKLKLTALARGWTVNYFGSIATGANKQWLSIQHGNFYWNLLSDTAADYLAFTSDTPSFIHGLQATGFNASLSWTEQPSSSSQGLRPETSSSLGIYANATRCNNLAGPFLSYHIFSGTNYIHVVVETAPETYSFISLGVLNKRGTYTGGSYLSMSSWGNNNAIPDATSHIYLFDNATNNGSGAGRVSVILRAEVDGNIWYNSHQNTATTVTGLVRYPSEDFFVKSAFKASQSPNLMEVMSTPDSFDLLTPLPPSTLFIKRQNRQLFSPVGEVPDFRSINMTRYVPAQEITVGTETWMVFPSKKKGIINPVAPSLVPSSGVYGHAFRKVL